MVVSRLETGGRGVCEEINVGKGLVFYEMDNLLDYRNFKPGNTSEAYIQRPNSTSK